MLSFIRITLLVIIEATWFPALEFLYLAPVYFLSISGAFLSIAAWAQLSRNGSGGTSRIRGYMVRRWRIRSQRRADPNAAS